MKAGNEATSDSTRVHSAVGRRMNALEHHPPSHLQPAVLLSTPPPPLRTPPYRFIHHNNKGGRGEIDTEYTHISDKSITSATKIRPFRSHSGHKDGKPNRNTAFCDKALEKGWKRNILAYSHLYYDKDLCASGPHDCTHTGKHIRANGC
jgi:hypothetical protein